MANDVTHTHKPRQLDSSRGLIDMWLDMLRPLGSLKITVVLFAMSIFIIFVGTMAQVDKGMWDVIHDYFYAYVSWIDFQVFFPRTWFPNWQNIPGGFPFPGGAAIGLALAVNLTAAHLARFQFRTSGGRLVAGLLISAAGVLVVGLVILSGHSNTAQQDQPPFGSWATVWIVVKLAVAAITAACGYMAWAARKREAHPLSEQILLAVLTAGFGALTVYLFAAGQRAYLGDSGMRILWQLIKAGIPAMILLLGLSIVYGKHGGLVLLHTGLGLLMFGQFFVAQYDIEEQMRIEENQTVSYGQDIRQTELAIVDPSDDREDDVVVIPEALLIQSQKGPGFPLFGGSSALGENHVIRHTDLPFDVRVEEYFRNARLRDVPPEEDNPATAGTGLRAIATPVRSGSGMQSKVDYAAAYVTFFEKDSEEKIGTFLVSQIAAASKVTEPVTVGQKTYNVSLRFRRNYKPYAITLKDVRKDDYLGTSTPRNYSSDIHLVDAKNGVDREIHIWMNNPLRYAGETFYQSGYAGPPDFPTESTTLQVVTNSGWLIPYVACMLVSFGMFAHFWSILMRFLRREETQERLRWTVRRTEKGSNETAVSTLVANVSLALLLLVFAVWLALTFVPSREAPDGLKIHAFGRLPLIADGRVKPFDTLARNSLRILSNRETFKDEEGHRQPAIRWLLDAIADPAAAEQHRVIRIDMIEVLDLLGLKRRKGNLYSVDEIRPKYVRLQEEVIRAREKDGEKLSTYERKVVELDQRLRTYTSIAAAFQPPDLPNLFEDFGVGEDGQPLSEAERQKKIEARMREFRSAYAQFVRSLESIHPALAVPVSAADGEGDEKPPQWESYARAWAEASVSYQVMNQEPPESVQLLETIFHAYREKKAGTFNHAVDQYRAFLKKDPPTQLLAKKGVVGNFIERTFGGFFAFEAYFNHVAPFYHCSILYLVAFTFSLVALLGLFRRVNRFTFLLILGVFVVHTIALLARIYISGRPPVTNLYSSAVFIGWAVVLFGLAYEGFYRSGVGNLLASALGVGSLIVAHTLADGDTFTVLQAVLDTQFWLTAHVLTVALGYATTFFAGALGLVYVLPRPAVSARRDRMEKELMRMIYCILCFSIFFSFVGTVLGGLWADDSWGRFWGWDPKENGALIIVIWNALILHARRGGMVKDRGLAILAIGGNMVTSWSWFGVNELGVGLHSYGFTEGALKWLILFNLSQLAMIVLGLMGGWWQKRIPIATANPS